MLKQAGISLLASVGLWAVPAFASDAANLCVFNLNPPSANISLPADDAYHYPEQWLGEPWKLNQHEDGNGQESTYKVSHWMAYPRGGGPPVPVDGFVTLVALRQPSPFAGGQWGWLRLLWVSILGPDNVYRHWFYIAPGQFAPRDNGYDLSVGGPGEYAILEVTERGPVFLPNPTTPIGRIRGAGGTDLFTDFVSTDGTVEFHAQEESLKRPNYPTNDGYDPFLRYYWARSYMASWGTLTYHGTTYDLFGTSWDDREWQFSKPQLLTHQRWYWIAIQIKGCVDKHGNKFPCSESMTTILAWNNIVNTSGFPQHYWNEVGPPPYCRDVKLTEPTQWNSEAIDFWVSPRSGISYARAVRVTAPSRGADLIVRARTDDQEVWKATMSIKGLWEGAATVEGTFNGKRVYGDAMLEQYLAPLGTPH